MDCGDHGHYSSTSKSCVCDLNYAGDKCDTVTTSAPDCGPHGRNLPGTTKCSCDKGYSGDLCDKLEPSSSGNVKCGTRQHADTTGKKCVCDTGYSGDACNMCATGYAAQEFVQITSDFVIGRKSPAPIPSFMPSRPIVCVPVTSKCTC